MSFDVSYPGSLKGRFTVPGDRRLTLAAMAFGMFAHGEITIINASPAPDVISFSRFLERNGAGVERIDTTITINGGTQEGPVRIDSGVPDDTLHVVIASVVFSGGTVMIEEGAGARSQMVKPLLEILHRLGLAENAVVEQSGDLVLSGAELKQHDVIQTANPWAFEAVATASAAAQRPVAVLFPAPAVSHSRKLVQALGCIESRPNKRLESETELSMRLARASGDKTLEIRELSWHGPPEGTLRIPGDVTLAAAVCGAATILERSDVIVKDILWEQGRRGFFEALRRMKASIDVQQDNGPYSFDAATIRVKWSMNEGVEISQEQALTMTSELLLLGAVAAYAQGNTVLSCGPDVTGVKSDVLKKMVRGLGALGAHVGDYRDGMVLNGGRELRGAAVDTGGNPDIALALTLAALRASGTTTIEGCEKDCSPIDDFLRLVGELARR